MSLSVHLRYDLASGPGEWDEFQKLALTLKATCSVSMNCNNECGLVFSDKTDAAHRGIYDPSRGGIVIYTAYEYKQWEVAVHEFAHHLQYASYCENVYGWHSYHESSPSRRCREAARLDTTSFSKGYARDSPNHRRPD